VIITRLKLDPFGFFSDREIAFSEGLNVILGPNEAGKSTSFNGLQKVLFTPSKLTRPQYKSERMERFCPLGGDTMHVELAFACNGNTYALSRTWGGTKASKLTLPGGSVLTDDTQIAEQLARLLPATAGTFKAVLMTYQSGLGKTLEELKTNYPDTIQGLGDIFRKAVFETDGVSIEQFKQKVSRLYHDCFSHWDYAAQYPEKGRGIENPWSKEVGQILKAYYKKEEITTSLAETKHFEEDFDRINGAILESTKIIGEKELYIQENSRIVEGVKERRTMTTEKAAIRTKLEVLGQVNSDWPVQESKIQELNGKAPVLKEQIAMLEQEKTATELEEKNRRLRDRFKKLSVLKEKLDDAEKRLGAVRKIEKKDLDELVEAQAAVDRLKAGITAGKLTVTITAVNDFQLSVLKDLDPANAVSLAQGGIKKIDAGGLVRLQHPDWLMEITSGKGDIQALLDELDKAQSRFTNRLKHYGVADINEAREINSLYDQHAKEVEKHKGILNAELGEDSFEGLASQAETLGPETVRRPLGEVIAALERAKAEIRQLDKDRLDHQNAVSGYQSKYGDKTRLLLEVAQCMAKGTELDERLSKLPPLPQGVEDPDAYVRKYEEELAAWSDAKEKRDRLMIDRAKMEGEMPEMSAEDLEKQLADAEAEFGRMKRRGEAIARIMNLTGKVLAELDSGSGSGLKKEVEEYVSHLTSRRYGAVTMEETLPQGFVRDDGKMLPYEYLSAGTKDVFSIALRLAMANHFLKDSKGFLVMDDPLVNMDPERQKRAAELIRTYAAEKQVIVFTCHPGHAEMLGGKRIEL
jgi:exonuclease SbcC